LTSFDAKRTLNPLNKMINPTKRRSIVFLLIFGIGYSNIAFNIFISLGEGAFSANELIEFYILLFENDDLTTFAWLSVVIFSWVGWMVGRSMDRKTIRLK